MTMSMSRAATPADALRTMRTIGLALAAGVTSFAALTWFLHRETPPAPADASWLVYLWIAIGTSLVAASMVAWRGLAVPWIEGPETGADWRTRAARIQSALVVCWSLVEAAALFGVVVYFLYGTVLPGMLGVFIMWAALALTWPQPEWLAAGEAAPQ